MVPTFESIYEKEVELALLKEEAEMFRIGADFMKTYAASTYMEAEEGDNKSFLETIKKIVNKIVEAIASIGNSIVEAFSNKEHITYADYMNSKTGEAKFNYDLDMAYRMTSDKLAEGNRLIRMLSKVSGRSPGKVSEFLHRDHGEDFNKAQRVVGAAEAIRTYNKYSTKGFFKDAQNKVKESETIARAIKDPEAQKDAVAVLMKMGEIANQGLRTANVGANQYVREFEKYTKREAKKNK